MHRSLLSERHDDNYTSVTKWLIDQTLDLIETYTSLDVISDGTKHLFKTC